MNNKKVAMATVPSAFLAAIVAWLMVTDCPSQEQAIINLATIIVGHGECQNYDGILSEIEDMAADKGFCEDGVTIGVSALPTGEWSNCDAACAILGDELFNKYGQALPERWSCKKIGFELGPVQEACREVQKDKVGDSAGSYGG